MAPSQNIPNIYGCPAASATSLAPRRTPSYNCARTGSPAPNEPGSNPSRPHLDTQGITPAMRTELMEGPHRSVARGPRRPVRDVPYLVRRHPEHAPGGTRPPRGMRWIRRHAGRGTVYVYIGNRSRDRLAVPRSGCWRPAEARQHIPRAAWLYPSYRLGETESEIWWSWAC